MFLTLNSEHWNVFRQTTEPTNRLLFHWTWQSYKATETTKKRLKCRPSSIFHIPCSMSGRVVIFGKKTYISFCFVALSFAVCNEFWMNALKICLISDDLCWAKRSWCEVVQEGMMIFISHFTRERDTSFTWAFSWVEVPL